MPSRQIGLTHLPNVYLKKTIWQQPKITENMKKQLEKLKEDHEKRVNSNHMLKKNMQTAELHAQRQQLQSMRHVNPALTQHRYQ